VVLAILTLMITTPSARARRAADAAIGVLADQGARGLTHRAVDQAAGFPPGTTSNYARTRAALLTLALARMAELDAAEGGREMAGPEMAGPGQAGPELADALATMLHRTITDGDARRRLLARLELALEASRRPELRAAYDEMGRPFRAEAARLLAARGSAEPDRDAWTLIAWLEGTAFYALAGAGTAAPPSRDALRAQLSRLLAGMCADDRGAA